MTEHSVFILAVEPSADKLGANLIKSIRQESPATLLSGIGGVAMKNEGVQTPIDISALAIMGYVEALKSYPLVRRKVKEVSKIIIERDPSAVVLIDSWGFMIRVAARLKKMGFNGKIIKYVAPQVWAIRPGRAKTLARYTDHLLSIHTMDAPYFTSLSLPVTFVGNPMFDEGFSPERNIDLRKEYKLNDGPIISILFGSRRSEIEALYEPFAKTVAILQARFPNANFVSVASTNVAEQLELLRKDDTRMAAVRFVGEKIKSALFSNTDVALTCSGTVTTQLAMCGVPSVVAYRLNPVTYAIGKPWFQPDHISLVNISANEKLIPEFLQKNVNAKNLSAAVADFLEDQNLRASTSKKLLKQIDIMKGKGGSASKRAALAILSILDAT